MQRAHTFFPSRTSVLVFLAMISAALSANSRAQQPQQFSIFENTGTSAVQPGKPEARPPVFTLPAQSAARTPVPSLPPGQKSAPLAQAPAEADNTLRELVGIQKGIFARAERDGTSLDELNFQSQLQQLSQRYEQLLNRYPGYAPAYVAYGLMLDKIGMRKESATLMQKANEIDDNLPIVKNQLGNYMAEEGRPLDAFVFYTSAIALDPTEPLYPYQLGNLLFAARDTFLQRVPGMWTRAKIDRYMQSSFREAMDLAPKNWRYAYRYGMSFYDLEKPNWEEALDFWRTFQATLKPGIEQQVCQLHQARVLVEMGRIADAQLLIAKVSAPELAGNKTSLANLIAERQKQ